VAAAAAVVTTMVVVVTILFVALRAVSFSPHAYSSVSSSSSSQPEPPLACLASRLGMLWLQD
jgi:hypothetical protein